MEVEPFAGHAISGGEEIRKEKIRPCPHCGQPMPIKDPWKALFRLPTLNEWITLFIIAMMLFAAWAYKHDIAVCREFIANKSCLYNNINQGNYSSFINPPQINLTNINLSNEADVNITSNLNNISLNETT